MAAERPAFVKFGRFQLDRTGGSLFRVDGENGPERLDIGMRAFDVLAYLVGRPGEVVSKDEIMAAVWPNTIVGDAALTMQISQLRRVLEPNWIQTVPGRGYRFTGTISAPSDLAAAPAQSPRTALLPPSRPSAAADWRVGRDGPLELVQRLIGESRAGASRVIFIGGEAGIGKTTLVSMISEQLSLENILILRGTAVELFGTNEAFLPLIDALRDGLRGSDGARLGSLMRSHAPLWQAQMPAVATTGAENFGATRERMLREFCDFMEAVSSERACVLVLEDLHWSDNATLDAIGRLAREPRAAFLAVLATWRSSGAVSGEHAILGLLRELRFHGQCTSIELGRLTEADVEEHLRLRLGPQAATELAEPIFRRTLGQPLFVVSLVGDLITRGELVAENGHWRLVHGAGSVERSAPGEVRDMLVHQIECLDDSARSLLEVASAAGSTFAGALVAAAVDRDIIAVERDLETLARGGPVIENVGETEWPDGTVSGTYSFRHALYQEVLHARSGPALRAQTHRRLGERLRDAHGDQAGEIAPVLAFHFEQGRDIPAAIRFLCLAAENATRRLANQEATNYLTHALMLVERLPPAHRPKAEIAVLRQRSWARRGAGDLAGSIQDLQAMVAAAVQIGDTRTEVNGLLAISRVALHSDRRACLEAAARLLDRSDQIEDEKFRALARGISASTNLYLNGWIEADAALCRDALDRTEGATDHATVIRRLGIEGLFRCATSDYAAARDAGSAGKRMTRALGDVFVFVLFNVLEATALLHLGEWRALRLATEEALGMAEKNANEPAAVLCRLTLAWLHVEALDFDGGRRMCEAIPQASLNDTPFTFYFQRSVLTKAYHGLGDVARTQRFAEDILRYLSTHDGGLDFTIHTQFHYCLADHFLDVGDLARASEHAMLLHDYTARAPDRCHLALAHQVLARIAWTRGDQALAISNVEQAVQTIGERTLPLAAWRVHRLAAEFYRDTGDAERARAHSERYHGVISGLASNFAPGDPLHASLMSNRFGRH
jgi:DNA-binding winged helix-turn-helix (wHTH) protein